VSDFLREVTPPGLLPKIPGAMTMELPAELPRPPGTPPHYPVPQSAPLVVPMDIDKQISKYDLFKTARSGQMPVMIMASQTKPAEAELEN